MGDWSNNLEYEHREYYGHFYDTDEDVHEEEETEEETDDLISRQAVDDVMYDYSRSHDVSYAQIMEYIDKIPSVENKGEWIPVSERLPEEDGCYLVAVKFDRYISNEICYFDADDRERPFCPTRTNAGSQYINHGYPIGKTLAWTYSPEPYKAEKGGEE